MTNITTTLTAGILGGMVGYSTSPENTDPKSSFLYGAGATLFFASLLDIILVGKKQYSYSQRLRVRSAGSFCCFFLGKITGFPEVIDPKFMNWGVFASGILFAKSFIPKKNFFGRVIHIKDGPLLLGIFLCSFKEKDFLSGLKNGLVMGVAYNAMMLLESAFRSAPSPHFGYSDMNPSAPPELNLAVIAASEMPFPSTVIPQPHSTLVPSTH